jgi:F-type H+-transporting ATPase subunit b
MLIDWFTIIAQVVNFLILVWLLKRFLYRPILNAIDAREKKIAKELADADAKKAEAQKERDEFQHKNEELDQQRAALLNKATEEAKAERQRLLDEARQAADALSAKRLEALKNDAHNLNQAISRRAQQEVFAIARKALTDLATTSLEARMVEVFTRRLREMDDQAKADLTEALKTASAPALVRSAFDLPATQRTAIQNALNQTFSAEINIRFETAPDLVSGIELTTDGQKVAWSIADYLASLEKGVDELLKEQDKAEAQAKKPSDLTQQIGKRAYELYEEHGRKEGLAVQDWEKAEREIRKGILDPVKTEPKPEAKAMPKPEVKPEAKAESEPEVEAKPENKVEPKPAVKAGPESAAKAEARPATEVESKPEVKPEAKAEPEPETEAKLENKVEPKSSAKAGVRPATEIEPKPEVKPEVKVELQPEAEAKPENKVKPEPEEPKPETKSL